MHSFRIGAAITARQANVPDILIKMMGRWKSNAYQSYIRTPPQELAKSVRVSGIRLPLGYDTLRQPQVTLYI